VYHLRPAGRQPTVSQAAAATKLAKVTGPESINCLLTLAATEASREDAAAGHDDDDDDERRRRDRPAPSQTVANARRHARP